MTPAESKSDRTDPPLTAADLDRLAALITGPHLEEYGLYEIECRRCKATTSLEEYGVADSDVIALCSDCAFKVVEEVPALLALARRGLEAEAPRRADEPLIGALFWGVEATEVRRAVEQSKERLVRAESAESKIAAALAEVERVRAAADELDEASMSVIHSGDGVGRFEVAHAEYVRIAAEAQAGQAAKQGGEGKT